jgi:hypothetical protein
MVGMGMWLRTLFFPFFFFRSLFFPFFFRWYLGELAAMATATDASPYYFCCVGMQLGLVGFACMGYCIL